jgi:hypothetical protein
MTAPNPVHPLRIAQMLESDGPGGAETMLVSLSEALRARGHTVFPVGPARGVGWLAARLRDAGFERASPERRSQVGIHHHRGQTIGQFLRRLRIEQQP